MSEQPAPTASQRRQRALHGRGGRTWPPRGVVAGDRGSHRRPVADDRRPRVCPRTIARHAQRCRRCSRRPSGPRGRRWRRGRSAVRTSTTPIPTDAADVSGVVLEGIGGVERPRVGDAEDLVGARAGGRQVDRQADRMGENAAERVVDVVEGRALIRARGREIERVASDSPRCQGRTGRPGSAAPWPGRSGSRSRSPPHPQRRRPDRARTPPRAPPRVRGARTARTEWNSS